MDKDRVVGSAKQVKGAVKQAVGKAVGDTKRNRCSVTRATTAKPSAMT